MSQRQRLYQRKWLTIQPRTAKTVSADRCGDNRLWKKQATTDPAENVCVGFIRSDNQGNAQSESPSTWTNFRLKTLPSTIVRKWLQPRPKQARP